MDEVAAKLVENFNSRVVWGNPIFPQQILNEGDLEFTGSVNTEVRLTDSDPWEPLKLDLSYTQKPAVSLDVNNITITAV